MEPSQSSPFSLAVAIGLVLLPAVGALVLIATRGSRVPGKLGGLFTVFSMGAYALIPTALVEGVVALFFGGDPIELLRPGPEDWGQSLLFLVFGVGLVEEVAKFSIVRFGAFRAVKGLRHAGVASIAVYTVAGSLGLAIFEDILYVFSTSEPLDTYATAVLRLLTAPGHVVLALIWVVPLARQGPHRRLRILGALLLGGLLHGLYNFLALNSATVGIPELSILFMVTAFGGMPVLTWLTRRQWMAALGLLRGTVLPDIPMSAEESPRCRACGSLAGQDAMFCHACGSFLVSRFCAQCGAGLRQAAKFCYRCGSAAPVAAPSLAAGPSVETETPRGRVVPLWRAALLGVLSGGLYHLYWLGATWDHLAPERPGRTHHPAWHAAASLVPLYGLAVLYQHVAAICRVQRQAGLHARAVPLLGPLTGLVVAALLIAAVRAAQPVEAYAYVGLACAALIALPLYGQYHLNRYWRWKAYGTEEEAAWGPGEPVTTLAGAVAVSLMVFTALSDRTSVRSIEETSPHGELAGTASGYLNDPDQPPSYTLQAEAGRTYVLTVDEPEDDVEDSLPDPALSVWSPDGGRPVAYNDDAPFTKMPRLEWRAPGSGTYHVVVESADRHSTGDYVVRVERKDQ